VAVFARDMETSQQVWSAEVGYPGNPYYREFYRDVGWDLPLDYLLPHLHKDGKRRHLGLKYYRITGETDEKEPYVPAWAREQAARDATHFLNERIRQAKHLRELHEGHLPLVVSPYDAELYGHWWYEGPQFLDFLFRQLHYDQNEIEAITPGDFLGLGIEIQTQQPSASSWGELGYYKVWLNLETTWIYPFQHDAEQRMTKLANRFDDPTELELRTLNQLARELLLAQASDWAFQIYQGTTAQYASQRFRSHIHRFALLAEQLEKGEIGEELLSEIELRDNIFSEIDYRIYRS
jgi:1,4-alpha-glucan branching enzyme